MGGGRVGRRRRGACGSQHDEHHGYATQPKAPMSAHEAPGRGMSLDGTGNSDSGLRCQSLPPAAKGRGRTGNGLLHSGTGCQPTMIDLPPSPWPSIALGRAQAGRSVTVHAADTTLTIDTEGGPRTVTWTTARAVRNLKAYRPWSALRKRA